MIRRALAALALLSSGLLAPAQGVSPWLGAKVVTKYRTPLRVGARVVDEDQEFRVYTVERVNGDWLWLASEGRAGWVRSGGVVPFDRALEYYTREIRANPSAAWAYGNRGLIRLETEDVDNAIADFTEAIRLDPTDAESYYNRGLARADKPDLDGAIADFTESIRLDPADAAAYYSRGLAWSRKPDPVRAVADFTESVRLDPGDADADVGRAWIWATAPDAAHRNAAKAVESATRACELSGWKDANRLDTLAAAYAEAGAFETAVTTQQKALDLLRDEAKRDDFRARLRLYRGKTPYRTTPVDGRTGKP